MESINESRKKLDISYCTKKLIQKLIKQYPVLKPSDVYFFIDYVYFPYDTYLIISKPELFPKDQIIKEELYFTKEEGYYYGGIWYITETNELNKLNKKEGTTIILFTNTDHEKIIETYRKLIKGIDINFVTVSNGYDSEYDDNDYKKNAKHSLFTTFLFVPERSEKKFSVVVLDNNGTILINRKMEFGSDEDYSVRKYILSNFSYINKPNPLPIEKKITETTYWYANDHIEDEELIWALLFHLNDDYTSDLLFSYWKKQYDIEHI